MSTYRYTLAAGAAVLAVTALAGWHHNAAEVPEPAMQVERSRNADTGRDTGYLPDLFLDEERAAPIEPLPPQF